MPSEDFEETPEAAPEHPMDTEENRSQLRHNRTLEAVFKNLELRPNERFDRFPRWVWEALADKMTYSVLQLSYQNRSPESIEDYYTRQGMIKAYENLGLFYSQRALGEAEKNEKGSDS